MEMTTGIGFAIVAAVTVVIWFVVKVQFADRRIAEARKKAEEIEKSAQQEAERLKKAKLVEAKDQIFDWRSEAEKEVLLSFLTSSTFLLNFSTSSSRTLFSV